MGMFDTFRGTIKCPKCKEEYGFEEQTKNYECLLSDLELGDYIDKRNANYFYEFQSYCRCGNVHTGYIAIRNGQIVGFYNEEEIENIDIMSLTNIEDGLARRLQYDKKCNDGCGFELKNLYEESYNIGDSVELLRDNWVIDEIYQEVLDCKGIDNDRLKTFYNCMFKKNHVYVVHNKANTKKRLLVVRADLFSNLYEYDLDNIYCKSSVSEAEYEKKYRIQMGCKLVKIA